jgi:fatty acid desaturase
VHNLIVPGRKELNDFIARWFFAAPAVLPFSLYRQRHLAHHRHVGTDEDTKDLYRRDIRGWKLMREALLALLGIDYIKRVFATLRRDKSDRMKDSNRLGAKALPEWIKDDVPSIAVTQLVLIAIFSGIDIRLYPLLWVLPIVTVSSLSSKIRALVEHRPSMAMAGSKPGSGFYMDTRTPCLRSVRATWVERILISNVNFHFHAEHHLWPFISYQNLPTLHRRLLNSPEAAEMGFTVEPNYLTAVRKLWAEK